MALLWDFLESYTWTLSEGITHNLLDRIMLVRRDKYNIRSLRGADCDTYQYLVAAIIRERLSLKQGIK